MRSFDLTPLFRSTVGFDRLADMLDSMSQLDSGGVSYPPYNIERTEENHYRISLAVAGFAEKDLSVEVKDGVLSVQGKREAEKEPQPKHYLYQGIAGRTFERRFCSLAYSNRRSMCVCALNTLTTRCASMASLATRVTSPMEFWMRAP